MDTALLSALLLGVAVFFGLMALFPGPATEAPRVGEQIRAWRSRRVAGAAELIGKARLELSPRTLIAITIAGPLVLGFVGLLVSPIVALIGLGVGLLLPRLYLRYLVGSEARAADEDAPRVLRAMVNRASAGGTYPDLFTAAAEVARHRWVRSDFDEVTARYYANEPLGEALLELRRRQASRNLRLVYDALAVAVRTQQAASAAGEVLTSLGEAARANRSIARAAAAESRGLRLQAAILAVVIPGLFLYLSAVNPELIAPATTTALGQFVLLPGGVLLEVTGIVLSWRITRLEA
ncbi:MAG TPA: type II secretion system F family protein [Candidatus Limnocylindrales bacterium]|nr:type II secretion system F family protein [Candidatus Limnocylindrales bacterium]